MIGLSFWGIEVRVFCGGVGCYHFYFLSYWLGDVLSMLLCRSVLLGCYLNVCFLIIVFFRPVETFVDPCFLCTPTILF